MKHFSKKSNDNRLIAKNPKKRIKLSKSNTGKNKPKKIKPKEEKYEEVSDVESDNTAAGSVDSSNDETSFNFNCSNSESEKDEPQSENLHLPPDSLEVASDDSDFEEESIDKNSAKVTIQMVNEWEKELRANKRSMQPVSSVVQAFHGCLVRISGDGSVSDHKGYRVDGSSVFNAVIRLCVTYLYPYLRKVMNLPPTSASKSHVENSKRWNTAKNIIRTYIIDLIKLTGNVTSEDILRVLLKHLHQMIPFAACLPTISKPILKQLITLWSSNNDDTVRVIAFLCILRYTVCDLTSYLHNVLKKMYLSYVVNCKFVSQNTIHAVNFMRKSLVEMFSLNEDVAYNHAFLYIRQLAIHLRSAIIVKKKDSIQAVYNWQFISSLRLWTEVLSNMRDKQQLNSLIYPTVQIIIGTIKLIPTAQYLPLRFHCIQMLNKLSKETGSFIPVLPFLLEALSLLKVNSQHKKLSMKPMDFTYILRLSKAQLQEIAFKDAVVENIHDYMLEYTAHESYRISFPETIVVLQIQLKQFLKDCKNTNYAKKFKPLLEKIDETSKMIIKERPCIPLSDEQGISAWESNMKLKSNSLMSYHESWSKLHAQKVARKTMDKIQVLEHKLPELKKLAEKKKEQKEIKSGDRVVLFASDDDEDDTIDKFSQKTEEKISNETNTQQKQKKKSKILKRKFENAKSKSQQTPKKVKLVENIETDVKDVGDEVKDMDFSEFLS